MTARNCQTRGALGLLVAMALGVGVSSAEAQRTPPIGPKFMVATFRAQEKGLGVQAAEVVRQRLTNDFQVRDMYVFPKTDIDRTLESSGYSTTEALTSTDARQLAMLIAAAEYLDATVTRTPAGAYRIEGAIMFPREQTMIQPLPAVEGAKLDDAAKALSREIGRARDHFKDVNDCNLSARQRMYPKAMASAQSAIRKYPNSVMARVCMLTMYKDQKFGADSMIRIGEEILKLHPTNKPALAELAGAYKEKNLSDKYLQTLTQLLAADPTNTTLQIQVVNELGRSGNAKLAIPIIDDAVKQNPGDPQLLRMQWLVLLNARELKRAVTVGEEIVRTDTAAATDTMFFRLANAYTADSQPQKAAEALARGVAKFPRNIDLLTSYGEALATAGQTQQAIDVFKRALAVDPKTPKLGLRVAQLYASTNQPDSAVAVLRVALAAGDSAALVSSVALGVGDVLRKSAATSRARADYEKSISVLRFADSVSANPLAKLLIAANQLPLGQQIANAANEARSCDMAKEAAALLTEAQQNIAAGGRANPQIAQSLMAPLSQLMPYAEQVQRAHCRSTTGRGGR